MLLLPLLWSLWKSSFAAKNSLHEKVCTYLFSKKTMIASVSQYYNLSDRDKKVYPVRAFHI